MKIARPGLPYPPKWSPAIDPVFEAPLIPGLLLFPDRLHALTPQSGVVSRSIVVGIRSPSRFPRKEPEKPPSSPPFSGGFFMQSGPDQQFPRRQGQGRRG